MPNLGLFLNLALCTALVAGVNVLVSNADLPGEKRGQQLMERTAKHKDSLPVLSSSEFFNFVDKSQRKYGVFAIFTTSSPTCRPCKVVGSQFSIVAREYRKQFPTADKAFFVRIESESGREVFNTFKLQGMPVIMYFPPLRRGEESWNEKIHDFSRSNTWTAFGIGQFVYEMTQIEIQDLPKPLMSEVEGDDGSLITGVVLVIFLLVAVAFTMPRILVFLRKPIFQFGVCALIWWLMISGFTYNLINHPPSAISDPQTKKPRLFHPSSHAQLSLEGYLMGTLEMFIGMTFLVINEFLPRVLKTSQQNHISVSIVMTMVAMFSFFKLRQYYSYKSPGYLS